MGMASAIQSPWPAAHRQILAEMKKKLEKYLDELTKGKKPCKVRIVME